MGSRLSTAQIATTFQRALSRGNCIDPEDTALLFYDLSFMEARLGEIRASFPPTALHAVAVKANPLISILKKINLLGFGVEAATLPELHLAARAGFPPGRIVFDSPVKTVPELEYALSLGVHVNADSFSDLDRIEAILAGASPRGAIGVRLNPQVGTGSILSTSTAGDYSKFGIPVREFHRELLQRFLAHPWLTGVHLHIGSQGISLEQLLRGLGTVMDFVHEANGMLASNDQDRRIAIIDLGGGLPVSYHPDRPSVTMDQYRQGIQEAHPGLFSSKFKLITEFGRYVHVNAGWAVSRVENVKHTSGMATVMIHLGADMFLRECYNPQDWSHELLVLNSSGQVKAGGPRHKYMVAGPLCFAGDLVAREVDLPEVQPGDFLVIQDSGAYTLSMWSRYNSRQAPKVIGYHRNGEEFELLKPRETIPQVLEFWV